MRASARRGSLWLLFAVQAVAAVGMAAGGSAGSLLAYELTGDLSTAELPLAALVIGATLAVLPVSAVMQRWGRREGLLVGLGVAALGAVVVVTGAASESLAWVLVGSALLGGGNTAVMFGRYVAADYVRAGEPQSRSARSAEERRPLDASAASAARGVGAALAAA